MKLTYATVMAGIGTERIDIAFPDFPGCVTVANSIQDAQERAADVLSFHVQSMVQDGDPFPAGTSEQALLDMIDSYERDGHRTMAASIPIDLPTGKAKRVNFTVSDATRSNKK